MSVLVDVVERPFQRRGPRRRVLLPQQILMWTTGGHEEIRHDHGLDMAAGPAMLGEHPVLVPLPADEVEATEQSPARTRGQVDDESEVDRPGDLCPGEVRQVCLQCRTRDLDPELCGVMRPFDGLGAMWEEYGRTAHTLRLPTFAVRARDSATAREGDVDVIPLSTRRQGDPRFGAVGEITERHLTDLHGVEAGVETFRRKGFECVWFEDFGDDILGHTDVVGV